MAPYTKADKNIRMKKILYTFILLTFCTIATWGKTSTKTIFTEDASSGAFNYEYDGVMDEEVIGTFNWDFAIDSNEGGGIGIGIGIPGIGTGSGTTTDKHIQCYSNGLHSTYMKFGYDESLIGDNWTFSFRAKINPYDAAGIQQMAVFGSNADLSKCETLTANSYFSIVNTEMQSYDYFAKVGNKLLDDIYSFQPEYFFYVTITCQNARSQNATLTVTVRDYEDYEIINETVNIDAVAMGLPEGFYVYNGGQEGNQWFDDLKLTKDVEIEDVTCANPTYTITGAYNNARNIELSCASENAVIYWAEEPLEIGDEGWEEYDGEISTLSSTVYAYAEIKEYEAVSEIKSFETGAGSTIQFEMPKINVIEYVEDKGYAFTVDACLDELPVKPSVYSIKYNFDGGTEATIQEGEIAYIPEGSLLRVYTTAYGYTKSWVATKQTSAFPKMPEVWGQDFISLVNYNNYGTDKLALKLSANPTFAYDTKNIYSIQQFIANGTAVNVSIDPRIGVSTNEFIYLQRSDDENGGLISYKEESEGTEYEEGEEFDYLQDLDGLGVNGIAPGQYIIINTNGYAPSAIGGCSLIDGASTNYNYVFEATDNVALLELPVGGYVKGMHVLANTVPITMSNTGVMTYVTENPLSFEDIEGLEARVVTEEVRSGVFNDQKVLEVPAKTAFILIGEPYKTYNVPLSSCSTLPCNNMLTGSINESYDPSTSELPVYVISSENGNIIYVKADKTEEIPAGVGYIKSELPEAEYKDINFGENGTVAIVCDKALDFTDTEGIHAYVVNNESLISGFTRKEITKAPAGAAIIITGTPNTTVSIPVGVCDELEYNNILKGSLTDPYYTADTLNFIYVYSNTTDEFNPVDKNTTSTIDPGQVYIISKYQGFEEITTNAAGAAQHISEHDLNFTETPLTAWIAVGETETSVTLKNVSGVYANSAFIVKNGEPNTVYKVPYGKCTITDENKFKGSRTTGFDATTENHYIYVFAEGTDGLVQLEENTFITSGNIYYISEKEIIQPIETEAITTNAFGNAAHISVNALDFSTVEGITAYIAYKETIDDGIMYKKVTEVPEGTAFFVEGKADTTYQIPLGTCTALSDNNLIQGSNETGHYIGNVDTYVYTLSNTTGKWEPVAITSETIGKGIPYIISKYRGFETIKTNAIGVTSYVTEKALDIREISDKILFYVIDYETPDGFHMTPVTQVPANEAILVKGEPDTEYKIPVGTLTTRIIPNRLTGSRTESTPVSNYSTYVYALSGKTGNMARVSVSATIPAGKAFLISKYSGFEKITTNEYGNLSYVCEHNLDFTEYYDRLEVLIATEETIAGINMNRIVKVPAGTAFMITGTPNTTFNVPIIETCEPLDTNLLKGSREEAFDVSTVDTYVYALSKSKSKLSRVEPNTIIEAGKAYMISKYRGFESIKLNSIGVASYVCENPLDFTELKDELSAFIVIEETEAGFTMKGVNEVPAGEAFFLKGTADSTYQVPIGTCERETWTWKDRNLATGSLTESFSVNSVTNTVYALSGKTGNLAPVSKNSVIGPKKAYVISQLYTNTASAKRTFGFTDDTLDTTNIENVTTHEDDEDDILVNLSGQKVDSNYKGIVIDKHGKKYLKK